MNHECIFCQIAQHKIPAKILYEDDKAMAFSDVSPQAPTHDLIIPIKHIATVNDLMPADNELIGHLFQVAKQLAAQKGLTDPGYRLVMNCNRDGGQAVYHIHLHLLGDRQMTWPPG